MKTVQTHVRTRGRSTELEEAERQSMTPASVLLSQEMGKSTACPHCKTPLHFLLFHSGQEVPCHRCEHLVRVP